MWHFQVESCVTAAAKVFVYFWHLLTYCTNTSSAPVVDWFNTYCSMCISIRRRTTARPRSYIPRHILKVCQCLSLADILCKPRSCNSAWTLTATSNQTLTGAPPRQRGNYSPLEDRRLTEARHLCWHCWASRLSRCGVCYVWLVPPRNLFKSLTKYS